MGRQTPGRQPAILAALLFCHLSFGGCGGAVSPPPPSAGAPCASIRTGAQPPAEGPPPPQTGGGRAEETDGTSYLDQLIEQSLADFSVPGMSESQRAKAAFDYMIEHTSPGEPIGPALWRTQAAGEERLPFLEQRALSPLRFGVGMCEDYAAALTLLLRGLGLEAEYVPGLTYSAEGHLVDHAWTVAKIDGIWYHLDCQLEDHISRHGFIRYRYFMKGDATMAGSHRWGPNLIESGLLTPEQNAEIAQRFPAPACPLDYPTPERHPLAGPAAPDIAGIMAEAEAELAVYEAAHGPLPPMELDVIPPVFGLAGYGPPDEG